MSTTVTTPRTAPRATGQLAARCFDQGSHEEVYLTGVASPERTTLQAAQDLYRELADAYARRGVQPIQEKVYGSRSVRDEVLEVRRSAFEAAGLDPTLPCTFHDGRPARAGSLAGIQAWGVIPGPGTSDVVSVEGAGGGAGRLWKGPEFELLHLPGVRGLGPDGRLARGPSAQAEQMFSGSQEALERHGFTFRDVRRTWIYVARILDWYGELNRVRTRFFREHGIGAGGMFPASTGIQSATADEECSMDVLALKAPPSVDRGPILKSERQGEAFSYGSAFSRAMCVQLGARQTVFVSGTASIDPAGRTRHLDTPDAQILETLLSISALLQERGGTLADLCSATLFCKRAEYLATFEQVTRLLGVPELPIVPVVADVCRPELLVEIEAIAVVPGAEEVRA